MTPSPQQLRKWRRSFDKRRDWVRRRLGLPAAAGWNRQREEGLRLWHLEEERNLRRRYDYPLTADDVVLDLGGFRGEWADEIDRRFGATVHVFEPAPAFHAAIAERFADRPNVTAHCAGLAGATRPVTLHLAGDSTTECGDGHGQTVEARLVDVGEFLDRHTLAEIALCKINIEGGEYELLEALLDRGLVGRFRNLLVQFHTFVPDADRRMQAIHHRLAATHEPTFCFPYVWENWRRRDHAAAAA